MTRAAGGRVKLVKIDIDKNQALVRQLAQLGLPMQSVPTVAAFWQGQIADMFQGAQPESEVKRFVEALLKAAGGSMPTADLLAEAKAAMEQGDAQQAGELFSALLHEEPENGDAWGGLIRALMAMGQEEAAEQALSPGAGEAGGARRGRRSAQRSGAGTRRPRGERPIAVAAGAAGGRSGRPSGALRSGDRAECDGRARAGRRGAAGDPPPRRAPGTRTPPGCSC